MQLLTTWFKQLQLYLAPRQKAVVRCFVAIEVSLVLFGSVVAYLVIANPMQYSWILSDIGARVGQIAVFLFCLTLLPGIIRRLGLATPLLQPIVSLLTLFRRHIGITMFLTAFVHQIFNSTVQNLLFFHSLLPPNGFPTFVLLGLIAWLLLVPVWLTSNDTSQRFLGKKWKTLQRLTYISIWFIFAHVALQGESLAIILAITAILEVLSWINVWRKRILASMPPSATL